MRFRLGRKVSVRVSNARLEGAGGNFGDDAGELGVGLGVFGVWVKVW